MTENWTFWSRNEKEILILNQNELTPEELRKILPNRSVESIRSQLNNLKLYPNSRTCRHCGKIFKPKRRNNVYCSLDCRYREARYKKLLKDERIKKIKEGLLKELERVKDKDTELLIIHVLDSIDRISGEEAKRNTANTKLYKEESKYNLNNEW